MARRLVAFLLPVSLLSGNAVAQTGGFLESATDTAYREPLSVGTLQEILPSRGRFVFPAPYSTIATRLTNATDCGGGDCVNYVGYSYWSNINNHAGSDTMLIVLGLDRSRGGPGPSLFSYHKTTGETLNLGPLFDTAQSLSWATGEGWYFSGTRPSALYLNDGPRMVRYDVISHASETVYDVRNLLSRQDVYLWQMHSSADDLVHSATVKQSTTFQPLGCVTYREDTGQSFFLPPIGDFDECQIDKSGRWLVIKDNVDRRNGEDNRVIDLQTGLEQVLYDEDGAAGHADLGFGYMVSEDNFASQPGAARVWRFDQNFIAPGQGTLVYYLTSWSAGLGHLAHGNARPDVPLAQQTVCSSHATRLTLPRVNEIVCYRLDGSLEVLVVAPNMTDLDAPGGGSDDYSKLPKGNRDVTGDYFIWTSNTGGNRLDAFIVHVPQSKLAGDGTLTPVPVTWASAVNLSTANNGLLKISGCDGCPDATAASNETIGGIGWVQWSAPETQTLRVLGLSSNPVVTGVTEIPFAIRLQAGTAEVRELGTYTAEIAFVAGDTFRISIQNGLVRYQKNGIPFYTSANSATGAMRIHAIVYGLNGALSNIAAAGATTPGGHPDTTAPTVSIDSPPNGAVVSGSAVVSARATDNTGVTRVELYLDKVLQTTAMTSPYQWAWNTATVNDGPHTLQAKAYDAAGNVGVSATSSVTVRNISISLVANVSKVKNLQMADLRWSGAPSAVVTVYRNGNVIAPDIANNGFYTDSLEKKHKGRYTYKVCDTGVGVCSAEVTVTFE